MHPKTNYATAATEINAPQLAALLRRYRDVRRFTEFLCEPLEPEDFVIQSMTDASPTRWHLAHTTWFFETFVLLKALPGCRAYNYDFSFLFNSYYNLIGSQFPRYQRGLLSRPTVREIFAYRRHVDAKMIELIERGVNLLSPDIIAVIETGLHHEQQHQELILTDIKHVLSCNPLYPVYRRRSAASDQTAPQPLRWRRFDEGIREIGMPCENGFCYDNESPRHRTFIHAFELANRLVTNGEYLAFIDDGGYRRSELWLSDGWAAVESEQWRAPLYWERQDGGWWRFTLSGLHEVDVHAPVTHLSHYEADAFARWSQARLPTEAEWETAAEHCVIDGNFAESGVYDPRRLNPESSQSTTSTPLLQQLFGDVWEWTASPYVGYPGYTPPPGALGEYNGKFMSSQMVLRGGSCATSRSHMRRTYRNFFPPNTRWQFSGLRLARNPT